MRTAIAGFLTATLYTLAIATLFAMAMPSQAELQASIEATQIAASTAPAPAIDAEATR
jgi:hypothetical protein